MGAVGIYPPAAIPGNNIAFSCCSVPSYDIIICIISQINAVILLAWVNNTSACRVNANIIVFNNISRGKAAVDTYATIVIVGNDIAVSTAASYGVVWRVGYIYTLILSVWTNICWAITLRTYDVAPDYITIDMGAICIYAVISITGNNISFSCCSIPSYDIKICIRSQINAIILMA